jgi:hypothetical protein
MANVMRYNILFTTDRHEFLGRGSLSNLGRFQLAQIVILPADNGGEHQFYTSVYI